MGEKKKSSKKDENEEKTATADNTGIKTESTGNQSKPDKIDSVVVKGEQNA